MSIIQSLKGEKTLTVLEFFIFNRSGVCLMHLDLQEDPISCINKAINVQSDRKNDNRYKLIFGLLFSMKSFVKNISPNKTSDALKSFSTSGYKLHFIELLNGLRFTIISVSTKLDFTVQLKEIYNLLWVNLISKNIFVKRDEAIKNEIFLESLTNYLNNINSSLS